MTKFLSVLAMLLLATPAFAQGGSTMSPPAPNAASAMPEPADSVPAGSLTSPGTNEGGVTTSTTTGQTVPSYTQGLTTPAAPSGSTGPTGNPSDAMSRTVPQPVK